MEELKQGKWGVWRVRYQAAREPLAAERSHTSGPVWLQPETVNVLGDADGLEVVQRLRARVLADGFEDETAEPLDDGSLPPCRFTEFRLLGIRPVAVVNLK